LFFVLLQANIAIPTSLLKLSFGCYLARINSVAFLYQDIISKNSDNVGTDITLRYFR